jgi:hypothetical protein
MNGRDMLTHFIHPACPVSESAPTIKEPRGSFGTTAAVAFSTPFVGNVAILLLTISERCEGSLSSALPYLWEGEAACRLNAMACKSGGTPQHRARLPKRMKLTRQVICISAKLATKLGAILFCLLVPVIGFAQSTTLITTFTNPTPGVEYFGWGVAALGADRVLFSAAGADAGGKEDAGVACLFSTNGVVLTIFTNPAPRTYAGFGQSLLAMGSDRVLIGAAPRGEAAYLFGTDGTLLTTITNPSATPADDSFSYSMATVGNDHLLLGALQADAGPVKAGAAICSTPTARW